MVDKENNKHKKNISKKQRKTKKSSNNPSTDSINDSKSALDKIIEATENEFVAKGKTLFDLIEEERAEAQKSLGKEYEPRQSTTILEIGDLAVGTKSFDPNILKGLDFFLQYNGYSPRIDQVIMAGGLKPSVPLFSSVSYGEMMRYLGNDPKREDFGEALTPEEFKKLPESDQAYAEKYWKGKITTPGEAEILIERHVVNFMKNLPNARIDYFHSDEDEFNMKMGRDMEKQRRHAEKLKELKEKKEVLKNLKSEMSSFNSESKKLKKKLIVDIELRKVYDEIKEGLAQCKSKERAEFLNNWRTNPFMIDKVPSGSKNKLKHYLKQLENEANVALQKLTLKSNVLKKRIKEGRVAINEFGELANTHQKMIEDLDAQMVTAEGPLQKIAWFTKHYAQHSLEEEAVFKLIKDRYNQRYYDLFDGLDFHVHTSKRAEIELIVNGADVGIDDEDQIKVNGELDTSEIEIGGKKYLVSVMHNMYTTNRSGKMDIQKIALENAYLAQVEEFYKGKMGRIPDIFLTVHGAGGFRSKPLPKYKEGIKDADSDPFEMVVIPEMCMAIKLSSLEDLVQLNQLVGKGLKVPATKRFLQKQNASGAVIHTIVGDESHLMEYVDSEGLAEIGRMAGELEKLDKSSGKYKKLEDKIGNKIKLMRSKILPKAILGDLHNGSSNMPGRPTNYDIQDQIMKYIQENYVLDERFSAALSEIVQGDIEHVQEPYHEHGPLPSEIEAKMRYMISEAKKNIHYSEKSLEEKLGDAVNLVDEINEKWEYINQLKPINSYSLQKKEAMNRLRSLFTKTLEAGGYLVFTSGNHPNKVAPGVDEAEDFKAMITGLKGEYDSQVKVMKGMGSKTGSSGTLVDKFGKKTYFRHVTPKGSGGDAVMGAMKDGLKDLRDADHVVMYHIHQAECGFANGTAYTIGAGVQSVSIYTETASLPASLRGFIMHYSLNDANDENFPYHAWHFVLQPTLERHYSDKRKKVEKLVETK